MTTAKQTAPATAPTPAPVQYFSPEVHELADQLVASRVKLDEARAAAEAAQAGYIEAARSVTGPELTASWSTREATAAARDALAAAVDTLTENLSTALRADLRVAARKIREANLNATTAAAENARPHLLAAVSELRAAYVEYSGPGGGDGAYGELRGLTNILGGDARRRFALDAQVVSLDPIPGLVNSYASTLAHLLSPQG